MQASWSRLSGGAAIIGGALTVLVSVPPTWYGLTPTDSYLFDAPTFSPLWINRTVVPVLAVLAALGLLAGLVGLVRRDWPAAGRARKWGGVLSVVSLSLVTVSVPSLVTLGTKAGTDVLTSLVLVLVGLFGALLLAPGLLVMAYGYARTDRPRIGYGFAGVVVLAPVIGHLAPDGLASLIGSLPIAAAWMILGVDLWDKADPLGSQGSG